MAIFNSYVKLPEGNTLQDYSSLIPTFSSFLTSMAGIFITRTSSADLNGSTESCHQVQNP
jgi:hypothetical protein